MTRKFDTLSDLAKSRSDWHFDASIVESSVTWLPRFAGNWGDELETVSRDSDNANKTVTITFGNYSGRNQHTLREELEDWGYPTDQKFVDVIKYEHARFVDTMVSQCGLIDPLPSLLRLRPGYVQPWHCDMYNSYKEDHGANVDVTRVVITLSEWDWGHHLLFGNEVIHQWHAGDALTWPYLRYHCASNAGCSDFFLLTITGKKPSQGWPHV